MMHKGLIESLRSKKLKRQKIIKNALRAGGKPMDLETIKSIQVKGVLDYEAFIEDIGVIFPLILNLVSEGYSIPKIEKAIGLKARVLNEFLIRFTRLRDEVQKVRKLKSDSHAR